MDGVIVNFAKGYVDRVNQVDPEYLKQIGWNGNFDDIEMYMQRHFESIAPNEKEKEKAVFRAGAKFWGYIRGDVQWWENLEWMPDGKELFNHLYMLRQNGIISEFNILSAPSKTDDTVPAAKRSWLDKHDVTSKMDRVIIDNDKFKYAESFNDILIDDTTRKLDAWANAGGTPLLHKNTQSTLEVLNNILLKDKS